MLLTKILKVRIPSFDDLYTKLAKYSSSGNEKKLDYI